MVSPAAAVASTGVAVIPPLPLAEATVAVEEAFKTLKGDLNLRPIFHQLEPRIDDFSHEIRKLRATVTKAQAVASEGWRSLNELIGDRGQRRQGGQWSGQPTQSSPF